jgi:hypothetical protein
MVKKSRFYLLRFFKKWQFTERYWLKKLIKYDQIYWTHPYLWHLYLLNGLFKWAYIHNFVRPIYCENISEIGDIDWARSMWIWLSGRCNASYTEGGGNATPPVCHLLLNKTCIDIVTKVHPTSLRYTESFNKKTQTKTSGVARAWHALAAARPPPFFARPPGKTFHYVLYFFIIWW